MVTDWQRDVTARAGHTRYAPGSRYAAPSYNPLLDGGTKNVLSGASVSPRPMYDDDGTRNVPPRGCKMSVDSEAAASSVMRAGYACVRTMISRLWSFPSR